MGLDEARRDEPPAKVERLAFGRELRLDDGNAPLVDADVGRDALVADHPGIAQDEVHDRSLHLLLSARPLLLAQVGLHYGRVGAQLGGGALLADGTRLQHVGAVGD